MTWDEILKIYLAYIQLKLTEQDWHAVSDACNDLRELEIKYKMKEKNEI